MTETDTSPELVANSRFPKKRSTKKQSAGVTKLKKRVQMAECKIVLMNQKLTVHSEEIKIREIETCESAPA